MFVRERASARLRPAGVNAPGYNTSVSCLLTPFASLELIGPGRVNISRRPLPRSLSFSSTNMGCYPRIGGSADSDHMISKTDWVTNERAPAGQLSLRLSPNDWNLFFQASLV